MSLGSASTSKTPGTVSGVVASNWRSSRDSSRSVRACRRRHREAGKYRESRDMVGLLSANGLRCFLCTSSVCFHSGFHIKISSQTQTPEAISSKTGRAGFREFDMEAPLSFSAPVARMLALTHSQGSSSSPSQRMFSWPGVVSRKNCRPLLADVDQPAYRPRVSRRRDSPDELCSSSVNGLASDGTCVPTVDSRYYRRAFGHHGCETPVDVRAGTGQGQPLTTPARGTSVKELAQARVDVPLVPVEDCPSSRPHVRPRPGIWKRPRMPMKGCPDTTGWSDVEFPYWESVAKTCCRRP